MDYRWTYQNADQGMVDALHDELKINSVLCELLVKRNIESYEAAKCFFRPSLDELHSPFLMANMDKAVTRIERAMKNGEKILIYGYKFEIYGGDGWTWTTDLSIMSAAL